MNQTLTIIVFAFMALISLVLTTNLLLSLLVFLGAFVPIVSAFNAIRRSKGINLQINSHYFSITKNNETLEIAPENIVTYTKKPGIIIIKLHKNISKFNFGTIFSDREKIIIRSDYIKNKEALDAIEDFLNQRKTKYTYYYHFCLESMSNMKYLI